MGNLSPELDPVQLFYRCTLNRADFAEALGVEKNTVDRWMCGIRKPGKQARRLAAELLYRWQNDGTYLES